MLDYWKTRGQVTAETTPYWDDLFAAIEGLEARAANRMANDDIIEMLTIPQIQAALGKSAFQLILRLDTLYQDDASKPIRDAAERFVRAEVQTEGLSCLERIDIAVVATRLDFWAEVAENVRHGQGDGGS